MAFYNAVMHVLMTEGLVDEEFVADRTENFEALRELALRYPPELAAQICGIDADTIRDVGRIGPRQDHGHLLGHGHQPAHHGTDNARCPDRPVLDHRQRRPPRHRPAPAARAEQRAGGV